MVKTDADLMADFQTGDKDAFDALINRHHVPLYNFFVRMTGHRTDAEDLTQEVFTKILRHAESYERTAKFTTYLYRIAKNTWIDRLRKHKRRGFMASLDYEDDNDSNLYQRLGETTPTPLEEASNRETGNEIDRALASLSEEHRMVFVLSEIQGMAYAEIAATLDIPVGTVKSRMHNAVLKLRERLKHLAI